MILSIALDFLSVVGRFVLLALVVHILGGFVAGSWLGLVVEPYRTWRQSR